MNTTTTMLHSSCVAYGQSSILITGKSGAGKSSLALQLIGMGGTLIADDRVILNNTDGVLLATCPAAISGMIEARGVGLLAAHPQGSAIVSHVVDLDKSEPNRLPPKRSITILGVEVDLIFGKDNPNLSAALLQLMKIGRLE